MGRLTTATSEQQASVAAMIDGMLKAPRPPQGHSWCQSWDVVCSYNEKHINELLRKRHAASKGRVLKNVEVLSKFYDRRSKQTLPQKYNLSFGPPLLKFDARGTSRPVCSLKMQILDGTVQIDEDPVESIDSEWKGLWLQLNGIPLGSIKGEIKDGIVSSSQAKPDIIQGGKTVHFDTASNEQQHVVLDFPIVRESLVVTVESDDPSAAAKSDFSKTSFQDDFKAFFTDPANCTALSYSIASVNNTSPSNGRTELEPTSFQFATFTSEKADGPGSLTALSLFIQVRGGTKTGVVDSLQSLWQGQWAENKVQPIPSGFTASLMLSAGLVSNLLLIPGFQKNNAWTATDRSPASSPGLEIEARNQGNFTANSYRNDYSSQSKFVMYGFSNALKDWPMKLKLYQPSGSDKPRVDVNWEIEQSVDWIDNTKGGAVLWGEGTKKFLYSIDDGNRYSYRQVPCTATMDDTAFNLDVDVQSNRLWRCSELSKEKMFLSIEDEKSAKAADEQLKQLSPKCTISSIGLGFLRTTNLLTPDREVIDFNEGIGLKCPKDIVLVGDILPQ